MTPGPILAMVLAHAGEEILFVLVPIVLWVVFSRIGDRRRAELERQEEASGGRAGDPAGRPPD